MPQQRPFNGLPTAREVTRRRFVTHGLAAGAAVAAGGLPAVRVVREVAAQTSPNASPVASPAAGTPAGDIAWPAYGCDPGGMSHAPATQIDAVNVGRLEVAWTFRTGELEVYKGTGFPVNKVAFEATPIMVDGTLYFSTASARVFALDAATGTRKWLYDPKLDLSVDFSNPVSRGVSTWADSTKVPGEDGYRTIFVGTVDARLIALDAATGRPVARFGEQGTVDLRKSIPAIDETGIPPGQYQVTSPPAVIGDLVIVGTAIGDNMQVEVYAGSVLAYDARTGEHVWSWDPIPRQKGQLGYDTWNGPIAHKTGASNAWPPISADPARGLVFVPTTSPSPDYYGGERLGQNLFADCVVALRAERGELVWAFQTTHHNIWDYDVPMQPVLLDLQRGETRVPAVAVGTKSGHIFVLDRETGTPLFPVAERPVPQTAVPGEETWPTQPFPQDFPLFGLREVTADDAWGLTPADQETARKKIAGLRSEGVFTPVGLEPTAEAPSNTGGFNWGGLTYDPERGIILGATNRFAAIVQLFPRDEAPTGDDTTSGERLSKEIGAQKQTPYVLERTYLFDLNNGKLPYTKPPWGTLAAVNLTTGKLQFEVPLGSMPVVQDHPQAEAWGSLNLAGPMTTAGGLTFVAATLDEHLRAIDTTTGEVLWQDKLPAGGQATPMSYVVNGKQYVVIAAGGHGQLGTTQGDYVIAYALPDAS